MAGELFDYDTYFGDAGDYSDTAATDWSYWDAGGAGDYDTALDTSWLQDLPAGSFSDYQTYFGEPETAVSYRPEAYDMSGVVAAQPGDVQFVGPVQQTDAPWYQPLYDAEKWTKQHPNLTSSGVGLFSFLSSAASARKQKKQQQAAYDAYMAEKNARAAKSAQQNAPWVPTDFRVRNTAVAGPTVGDRYGVSSRGSGAVNSPANYNYFTNNRAQLAVGGLAHVRGSTGGQDDKVPAMLSDGEYVFDADVVSALGDGNNEAGAAKLDEMRQNIRAHKRSGPLSKIPPKAKKPEAYLKKGK